MLKPRLRATARWTRSFAPQTPQSGSGGRSRAFVTGLRIYAFDNNGMVGKARITVGFEGRKYGGRGSSPDAVEAAAHAYLRAVAAYLSDEVPRFSTE
jgi:hypothetical protein